MTRVPGSVYGTAGAGLAAGNNAWAANDDVARIGRGGELRTAEVLNRFAVQPGGPDVLHDLTIPSSRANIDHVVVAGNTIYLIDTKVWKPGRYWTLGSKVFRGLSRFPHAEKQTMAMAADRVATYLNGRADVRVKFHIRTMIVVWPSSRSQSFTALTRIAGMKAVSGDVFAANVRRHVSHQPANKVLTHALAALNR